MRAPASLSLPIAAPSSATGVVVQARALRKRYGEREVVCGIDLDVPPGGCFGLLGPNGAGKTTTLRMILGQSPFSGGSLTVLGQPMPAAARAVRARIGVVPQLDNLDPDFTVRENLEVYASFFGLRAQAVRTRIDELLELVELEDRADTPIRQLSGGMKRRLSIARALINEPDLVILDEPTTGLDPQVRHLIWQRLRTLKSKGTTLLLTTHYMEEAERLCDALVVIDAGRIISTGSPRQLIRAHVESDVIEIHAAPGVIESALADADNYRLERLGEITYCYTNAAAPLVTRLEKLAHVTYTHRPASLEDVFLKLTGRELRD
ncbi:MAG: ATP-binding cassette domain-containing protein [Gammaproteobacteria bacterium]|nr:ATP-binding cassette domain-containing protein [Gammaproteobacteria bacterium]